MRKIFLNCRTDNLEEYREVAKFASENGFTHMVISQVEPSMWQWDRDRRDPYSNWSMLQSALFKIVIPEKLKKYLPEKYAERNFETFVKRAEILKEFGLKAVYVGCEPAWLPEEVYLAHPTWRGPRCDQPRRSRHEYYAPCTDNPEVVELYRECVHKLCSVVPIEYFEFLTNDSGSGICWSGRLYPGANGPTACRHLSVADRAVHFLSVIQEAAKDVGVEAEVGYNRNFLDTELSAVAASLKPNQFCGNYTYNGKCGTKTVQGDAVRSYDGTSALAGMPLTVRFVNMMLETVGDETSNIYYWLSSAKTREYFEVIKACRGRLENTVTSKYNCLRIAATALIGEKYADNLVNIWEQIHYAEDRLAYLNRGGHILNLGTIQQRWLTRPLVPFPEELAPEEKAYYRDFQFQARTEADADRLNDMQATIWCAGESARWMLWQNLEHAKKPLNNAISMIDALLSAPDIGDYAFDLRELKLKLRMYKCIMVNANNVIHFQSILDRSQKDVELKDENLAIEEQGDPRYYKMEGIIREEIDNTYEMIAILDEAKTPILSCTPTVESKYIMKFGPDVRQDLCKKIELMMKHKLDLNRLYHSYNL